MIKFFNTFNFNIKILFFFLLTYNYFTENVKFKTFKNDPLNLHYCELENGLKIYLVDIKENVDISVNFIYNVGSKDDPEDNTGLAHYLEHLMFQGTDKLGSINYTKEKPLLDKIENLFEGLKKENNENKKEKIINKIEKYTLEASKYSISRELNKALTSYGCKNTNAETNNDSTTFYTTTSKQYLERVFKLFREQLTNPVFRNFYNELQTVYEEYMMHKENQYWILNTNIFGNLFKSHPYKNAIIGKTEHLKKPSIKAVKEFFKKYYVPNNCSIVLVGDIDYEKCYNLIKKYFGDLKPSKIDRKTYQREDKIEKNIIVNAYSEKGEYASFCCKYPENDLKSIFKIRIASDILSAHINNLIVKELICEKFFISNINLADSNINSVTIFNTNRQSLEDAKKKFLNKVKDFYNGNFDEKLLIGYKNAKTKMIRNIEKHSTFIVESLKEIVSNKYDYQEYIDAILNTLKNINKNDIMKTVEDIYKSNSLTINKYIGGRDYEEIKVREPLNVSLNNDKNSKFIEEVNKIKTEDIQRQVIDYKRDIKKIKVNDYVNVYFTKKNNKKLFNIRIDYNYGIFQNPLCDYFGIIMNYLKNNKLTTQELSTELSILSSNLNIRNDANKTVLTISGLSENLEKTLQLIGSFITNCTFDKNYEKHAVNKILEISYAYEKYNKKITKNYEIMDIKKDKKKLLKKKDFDNIIKNILSSSCEIYVDCDSEPEEILDKIKKSGLIKNCKNTHKKDLLKYNNFNKTIFFINDIKSSQDVRCIISEPIEKNIDLNTARILNKYQYELIVDKTRSKSLYNVYSFLRYKNEDKNHFQHFFSIQPNKFSYLLETILGILNNTEFTEAKFKNIIDSLEIKLRSKRYDNYKLIKKFISDKELEIDVEKTNSNSEFYKKIQNIKLNDLIDFYNKNTKNKPKIIYVQGNIADIDFDLLQKYGEIEVLQ